MLRPALGRAIRSAATATARRLQTSAVAAAALPALASTAAPLSPHSCGPDRSAAVSMHPVSCGLTPQQAFQAHSMAQLGGGGSADSAFQGDASGPHGGSSFNSFEADEVAARLREHLEASFSAGKASKRCPPPPGMCAPLAGGAEGLRHAVTQAALPAAAAAPSASAAASAASARAAAQAVAARLTKKAQLEAPVTVEAALQPSPQPRLVVDAEPPFKLAWANPAWEELSGLQFREVAGQPCLDVHALGPLADSLAGRQRGAATLHMHMAPEPGCLPLPVHVTASPLLGRDGSSSRMLLVFAPAAH